MPGPRVGMIYGASGGREAAGEFADGCATPAPTCLVMTDDTGPGQASGQIWLFEEEEG